MNWQVVSFDLWGTLITYGDREAEAEWRIREFGAVLGQLGHAVAVEAIKEAVLTVRQETFDHQRATGQQASARDQVAAMTTRMGLAPDETLQEVLAVVHTNAVLRADPQLLPGAREALQAARERADLVVLTSNTLATPASVTRTLLEYLDVAEQFDAMFFSSDLGFAKPRRELFDWVVSRTAAEPENIVHIGNEWHSDIAGALRAGWRAIWFNPTGKAPRPEAPCIGSLSGVPMALDELVALQAAEERIR